MKNTLVRWLHQVSSPYYFDNIAKIAAPWCYAFAGIFLAIGAFWGLFIAPADYQQKDAFRIIYVHVPAAVMSMGVYVSMAIAALSYYVWQIQLAAYYCRALAILGSVFTSLALLTGALWGKPMWGTYWSWQDPRILTELILLFLYLGYIALISAIESEKLGDKIGAILLMVGVVNIPLIHYSVEWWNSIHQGPTLLKLDAPSISLSMLLPLLVCLLGFILFTAGYAFTATRTRVIEAKNNKWLLDRLH